MFPGAYFETHGYVLATVTSPHDGRILQVYAPVHNYTNGVLTVELPYFGVLDFWEHSGCAVCAAFCCSASVQPAPAEREQESLSTEGLFALATQLHKKKLPKEAIPTLKLALDCLFKLVKGDYNVKET